ncbi:hypothetical protein [Microbacterium sp. LWH10-1.2]|uniref:hypothetical protein n=1 Tax=unclassified Microbacterium TaxID=2609290 RepID=UPI003139E9CD
MRTARKGALFITAIAIAVGLTGCSGGGQSVADACKLINDKGQEISTEAQTAMTEAATDPKAAAEALAGVNDEFQKLAEKVTNTEVKPVFDKFTDAYSDLATLMKDVAEDPSSAAKATEKLTASSTAIQESGLKLQELCS